VQSLPSAIRSLCELPTAISEAGGVLNWVRADITSGVGGMVERATARAGRALEVLKSPLT
jgi:hypothetical protein